MGLCKIGTPGRKEYRVAVCGMNSSGHKCHITYSVYTTSKALAEAEARKRAQEIYKTVLSVKAL